MKRILVTGGAGFIGSHLCEKLLKEGNNVVAVDNLSSGTIENIIRLKKYSSFDYIFCDVRKPYDIGKIDEIYNFACPASPIFYQIDPILTWECNIYGSHNALELAKKYDAKILQASTSEVYGDPKEHPQSETYWGNVNPDGIRSCYDEGKRAVETLMCDYHRQYGVQTKIIRIFNTYGTYMRLNDGRVITNFILQAIKSENITIYGDGKQTRSFQYITDLLNGIEKVMETDRNVFMPINLGNPSEFSMLELAEKILSKVKSSSEIVFKPLPEDDPKQRKPNINLAKTLLGWEPKVTLDEGLDKMIAFYTNEIKR